MPKNTKFISTVSMKTESKILQITAEIQSTQKSTSLWNGGKSIHCPQQQ